MKTLLFTLVFGFSTLCAQSLTDVTAALGRGDVDALSAMMGPEIDLKLLGDEGFYGRADATAKLRTFFAANTPTAFSQVHQGSSKSDSAEYLIGNLATSQGSYRVYVYVEGNKLGELRIEKE